MGKKELGIYVHIPFCVKKCNYCDFLSAPATEETQRAYISALCREIEGYGENLSEKYVIKSIFFGGGTPSLLPGTELVKALTAIRSSFSVKDDCEITVECNPGTLDTDKLSAYGENGVNRLSLGLQSANDGELEMLGRIHTFADFMNSFELARKKGFANINVDLISALPGQTAKSYENTLKTVARLRPEHISAYSLILEDGTGLKNDVVMGIMPPLPGEDEERKIYYLTEEILGNFGYEHYEISNYARQGHECRHNEIYWERGDYLGVGLGASSFIGNTRFCNIRRLEEYINEPAVEKESIEKINDGDAMAEFMYLGLRMLRGVSKNRFRLLFGRHMENVYGNVINRYVNSGHLIEEGDIIRLSSTGIDVSNYIFADFIPD